MRALHTIVALALTLCVAATAAAQDRPTSLFDGVAQTTQTVSEAATNATEEEGSGQSSLPVSFDLSLDGEIETRFFSLDELGFDGHTFEHIVDDASHWMSEAAKTLGSLPYASKATLVAEVGPWVLVALVALFVWFVDRRARRGFAALANYIATTRPSSTPRVNAVRRAVVTEAGHIIGPALAWLLSYMPIQGLFDSAPWTVALSEALSLLVLFRLVVAGIDVAFDRDIFELPEDATSALRRVALTSGAAILFFVILSRVVATLGYRSDVHALSQRLLRLSITLLSLRVLGATGHIARLLPDEGSPKYLRFKTLFVRYLRHFIIFSVVLLSLWTLGFTRAATTVLVRSYGIAALLVAGALALRWFDRYRSRPHTNPFVADLVSQVDSFARFCINLAFGGAILALLGLLGPLLAALDSLGVTLGEAELSLLGVLRGVGIVMGAVLLSRVLRVVLEHIVYPALEVDVGAAYAINTALQYFLIALSFGLALIAIGIDFAALAVFAGALGVGLGFGLQDFARNMVSGFVLLFGRIIRKGDLVTISDRYLGHVEEIGGRMVRIRTRDNTDLVIPASEVVGSALVNWTHDTPVVRLQVPVGVSYGADPSAVREALLDAAARFDVALRDPSPDVWFCEFGDNSINFKLLIWVSAAQVDPHAARGKLMFHIWDALAERGIEIPFPQRDLHLRSVSPEVLKALQSPDALRPAPEPSTDDQDAPAADGP